MITVKKEGILLSKTTNNFENDGVLNPAVIREGDYVHMFYRAVRVGNISTIGYCKLQGPLTIIERNDTPLLVPRSANESHGLEDPRIVKIDDLYYLSYTAYDGVNAMGALAVSRDLEHFEHKGLIVPQLSYSEFSRLAGAVGDICPKYLRYNEHDRIEEKEGKKVMVWDKNIVFFPRRIHGKMYFFHRIRPDIQIASFYELSDLNTEYWERYFLHFNEHIVITPKYDHEVSYLGGGCPPIETEHGWLMIYHGVHDTVKGYVYAACAALLDLDHPGTLLSRLPYPLFKPDNEWELTGVVNNVCFPTGTALFDDTLYIYYGAADEHIACASVSLSGLVQELLMYTNQ